MSLTAEFATRLNTENPSLGYASQSEVQPISIAASLEKITDVRAMIFDLYGTLVNYWKPGFEQEDSKAQIFLDAFTKTIECFGMGKSLTTINPADVPAKTLNDFYHGLIAIKRDTIAKSGVAVPEIRIEQIWETIILMLKRHGYSTEALGFGGVVELSRCMAYFYNFHALGRGFFDGVVDTLLDLKKRDIKLGILSNAQFYSPMDITMFLRQQSNGEIDDYLEIFDQDLIYFSYEYGVAKPDTLLFRKLYDALYEYRILPAETVFVGNDLASDIAPALDAGMKTALFCGNRASTFLYDLSGKVIPHVSFELWNELPQKISFFGQ